MNERITTIGELMEWINSPYRLDEVSVEADYTTRRIIISYLSKNDEWEEDCYINASTSQYYDFVRKTDKAHISIHDGENALYDDIILTKNSILAHID